MRNKIKLSWATLALIFTFIFASINAMAASPEVRAVGTAKVSGWSVDADERREARTMAFKKAVNKWISQQQPKHYKNYKKIRSDIESNIEDYVLEYTDTNEEENDGELRLVVRVVLNQTMLMDELISVTAGQNESEYIAIVFVAREHAAESSRTEKEASKTKFQTKGIAKDKVGNNATITKSKTQGIKTETNETVYQNEVRWRGYRTNEINVAMGDVFTGAEYLVIDADYIGELTGGLFDVQSFVRDYELGDDIAPSTKREAMKGLKSMEESVRYMAIGTLDVDKTLTDDNTGQPMVVVSATGQVLDAKRLGAAVAKVGPIQYTGLGKTAFEAKNNALKLAGEQVATELVARLTSRAIR